MRTVVAIAMTVVPASCAVGIDVLDTPLDGRTPVVVDVDMGGDDLMALLYVLQQADMSVRAVTVTGTGLAHCPAGGAIARAVLDHLGYPEIPVACGPAEPLEGANAFPEAWRTGADGLGTQLGLDVPESVPTGAIDLLIETIEQSNEPVRLLALRPLTNVALAIEKSPEVVENLADIVIMGGAVDVSGSVDPSFAAEWNIWADPVAANRVLQSGVPVTLVPLDATNMVPATRSFYVALAEQKATPEAELVYGFFTANPFNLEGGAYFFWDPLAAMIMVDPSVGQYETRRLEVDEQSGATVQAADGAEIRVAVGADRQRFEEGLLTALNGGIPAVLEVPVPDLNVRFDGESCVVNGSSSFTSQGDTARVVVGVMNETEQQMAIVFGSHEGATFEQLQIDATEGAADAEPPPYWEETGFVAVFGGSITGGLVTEVVDLVPGQHAVVCVSETNEVIVAADLLVESGSG